MAKMNETPSGMRTHIGVFGKVNAGKSSLINALTGQEVSIVSDSEGTTTDPVYRAMEFPPLGPCLFMDTPGLGDKTLLGEKRLQKTQQVAEKTDLALLLLSKDAIDEELALAAYFKEHHIPVLYIVSKCEELSDPESSLAYYRSKTAEHILPVSAKTGTGLDSLKAAIIEAAGCSDTPSITGDLAGPGDTVLLVMPQDRLAPKGRLILAQVMTIRELLDKHCVIISCSTEEIDAVLNQLKNPPNLIITDSQVFDKVFEKKPEASALTSFSILYAGAKGDVETFIEGAKSIATLKAGSRILVAESCTHAPLTEDIGREKIPALLRKKTGGDIEVEVYAGKDFPDDLTNYDLILQCGGCVANRREIMSRIEKARNAGVPITNYGICIAYLKQILDKITVRRY